MITLTNVVDEVLCDETNDLLFLPSDAESIEDNLIETLVEEGPNMKVLGWSLYLSAFVSSLNNPKYSGYKELMYNVLDKVNNDRFSEALEFVKKAKSLRTTIQKEGSSHV